MTSTPTTVRVGASLRARRISLGFSQAELSDQLGISRTRISAMENGVFGSARLLFEVSAAIGLDVFLLARNERAACEIRHSQESTLGSIVGTRVKRPARA